MKFVLVVLAALGLTMAWQASVVADSNTRQLVTPVPQDASLHAAAALQRG